MNHTNKHPESSRINDNLPIIPSPNSAAAIIRAAKYTLSQLQTNKIFQKPRLPLKSFEFLLFQ